MGNRKRLARMLVAVAIAGCSRQPTENPATPHLQAPVAVSSSAVPPGMPDTQAREPSHDVESSEDSRRIPLRHNRPTGDMPLADGIDFAPGSPPGAEHPAGTSFVVQLGDDDRVRVTEWDLATRTVLHEAKLDLPGTLEFLQAPGASVRIMSSAYNGPLYFVQLTRSLELVTRQELGHVSVRGPNAFSGDGSLTVVLADGIPDATSASTGPSGVFAMSFDAAGNRLAKRMLALSEEHGGTLTPMMNDNLAVIDGHVFVALMDPEDALHILRLAPDLRTERDRKLPLHTPGNLQAKLRNLDDHLALDLPDHPDLLELPLDLDLAHAVHRPRPAPPPAFPGASEVCGPSLRLASELLALCNCGKQTCLSWAPLPP
jgi:hypothetical protein